MLFASPVSYCNTIITGAVKDSVTGEPLKYANVFISGTTIGTKTDSLGNYKITNIPMGSYKIVASYVGYTAGVKKAAFYKDTLLEINFSLSVSSNLLNGITINASREEEWQKYYKIIATQLLGVSDNLSQIKILNPENINIKFDDKEKIIRATSDRAIRIINNALGYKIEVYLSIFDFSIKQNYLKYSYFVKFEEQNASDKLLLDEWNEQRQKVYAGSIKHFFTSLFANNLENESFTIVSGKLNNLLDGLGMWTSPKELKLSYNADSTLAVLKFSKCIKVSVKSWSILDIADKDVILDKFGNLIQPEYLPVYGKWANERIANMLPGNFQIKK